MCSFQKIGLIAGQGQLPQSLLSKWDAQGIESVVVSLSGITDPVLSDGRFGKTFSIGQAGHILDFLQSSNVTHVVMAGGLNRPNLWTLRTDFVGLRIVFKALCRHAGDDSLLKIIKSEIERRGISVAGAHEFLPDIIAPSGVMGAVNPAPDMQAIIATGFSLAKAHGRADKGQAVIVNAEGVMGVETKSGTNALIRSVPKGQGGILVKASKPQQDLNLDMPTIGVPTVEAVIQAGLIGIVVEAGKTIIMDRSDVIKLCDENGIFLIGTDEVIT